MSRRLRLVRRCAAISYGRGPPRRLLCPLSPSVPCCSIAAVSVVSRVCLVRVSCVSRLRPPRRLRSRSLAPCASLVSVTERQRRHRRLAACAGAPLPPLWLRARSPRHSCGGCARRVSRVLQTARRRLSTADCCALERVVHCTAIAPRFFVLYPVCCLIINRAASPGRVSLTRSPPPRWALSRGPSLGLFASGALLVGPHRCLGLLGGPPPPAGH